MHVLAVGAHPDDIELGCGGALLAHVAAGDTVTMLVMTTGERGPQASASRVDEQRAAAALIGAQLRWAGFDDGEVRHDRETVSVIDAVIADTGAQVLYTHSIDDTHQDHQATSKACLSAARRMSRVMYYTSPSATRFNPTLFVDIDAHIDGKLDALRCHASQVERCQMVDLEAIAASARHYGHTSRLRHAEAFEVARFVWNLTPAS